MKSNTHELMKARGLRSFQVWIPYGLYEAVRKKLWNDNKTAINTITKLLTIWSGWKPDEEKPTATETGKPAGTDAG